jgi:hypothetical protein
MQHMLAKTTERRLETVFGRFLRGPYHSIDVSFSFIRLLTVCVALLTMSALITRFVSVSILMIVLGRITALLPTSLHTNSNVF